MIPGYKKAPNPPILLPVLSKRYVRQINLPDFWSYLWNSFSIIGINQPSKVEVEDEAID